MRTTVILPDELMRQVKEHARAQGTTVTSVLELALRRHLVETTRNRPAVSLPAPGGAGGLLPGIDISSNASVAEAMDQDLPLEKLRSA